MGKEDINPNLGLISRPLPNGGPLISMVKSKPGVYYDVNGEPVSDEMAQEAGFDVPSAKREKAKRDAKADAMAKIDARFAKESAEVDSLSDSDMEEKGMVAPGSFIDPSSKAAEPGYGQPFVTKTSTGEPRVARLVKDGPVMVMEYDLKAKGWKIYNRETGKVVASKLSKEDATELLLGAG